MLSAGRSPTYPTIPHMARSIAEFRSSCVLSSATFAQLRDFDSSACWAGGARIRRFVRDFRHGPSANHVGAVRVTSLRDAARRPARGPDAALRYDDLRGDVGARGTNRRGEPRTGLPGHGRPARDARGGRRGDAVRAQPVPARPRHARAARRGGGPRHKVLGPDLRPGRRGPGDGRRDRGDRRGDPRAVRAGRRGRLLRAVLRLVRGVHRARRCGAPSGDTAPRRERAVWLRSRRAPRRVRRPHPGGAAQLPAQPHRQGLHP